MMDSIWKEALWRQFGAAIGMLENALSTCPEDLWCTRLWYEGKDESDYSQVWYLAYHTLFWLDLYLSGAVDGFDPPSPFNLDELDPAGILPARAYSREELLAYLEYDREKCRLTISGLTDEKAQRICKFPWGELPFAELLLDNMRHVQEHSAQLSMVIGQELGANVRWVARTKKTL